MARDEKRFQEKIKTIQDTMFVIGGKWKIPIILSICKPSARTVIVCFISPHTFASN